jgi:hypothetical protein
MPASPVQHPVTQLFGVLRMDLVLSGSVRAVVGETVDDVLLAGDTILTDADVAIMIVPDAAPATLWTAFFYSPDPCCCRQRVENP